MNFVEFEECECDSETDLALWVIIAGVRQAVPRSVVDESSDILKEGDTGTLIVKTWWARENGLI